jgi:hypothetical protein
MIMAAIECPTPGSADILALVFVTPVAHSLHVNPIGKDGSWLSTNAAREPRASPDDSLAAVRHGLLI